MAQVTSAVTPVASSADVTSITTTSFTPDPFDLLVLLVAANNVVSNTYEQPPISCSLADAPGFVQVYPKAAFTNGANPSRLWAFVGVDFEEPLARTYTVTLKTSGTALSTFWGVYRVSGMKRAGFGAVRQVANQDNGSAAGTPAPVFPAACLTDNPVIGLFSNASNPAGVTEPAGFTETIDTGGATPAEGYQMVFRNFGFTGTTLTWGGASATVFAARAIELDTRDVTPGDPNQPPRLAGRGAA